MDCDIVESKFKLPSHYYDHFELIPLEKFGWLYGISTIVGYLMPNPFYTYITYHSISPQPK